jgi:hypothetical protein
MADHHPRSRERLGLGLLICFHILVSCVSLVYVANYSFPASFDPPSFHVFYDPSRWYVAVAMVAAFAIASILFVFANFSFGYFAGFYFYMMVLGYLWLGCFTNLQYDHWLAGWSAAASAVAFLLPALFVSSPIRHARALSAAAFDQFLTLILLLSVATVAIGAKYSFHLGIGDMYHFREKIESPTILNYVIGMTDSALLPFAFAAFAARKAYWRAGAALLLLCFFYPITLTKIALFTPFWLVAIWLLSKLAGARAAVVLSLLVPIASVLVLLILFEAHAVFIFTIVNFRLGTIPSVAMEIYNDFFSRHELTHFCQILFLKQIMSCPYQEQLGVVMEKAYQLGNFNASLFATEGIASVGVLFAPIAVFICGLIIALGNRLSAGLPADFVLISGAIIPQLLLNVPLTTVLLTHGAALLFLLWYVTPRSIFEPGARTDPAG